MGAALGPLLIVLVAALFVGFVVTRSIRSVGTDERLVVFRMGRVDRSLVRGPGLVVLLPVMDQAVRVSLAPQRFELAGIGARASDGTGIRANVEVTLRVIDPFQFVLEPEASVPVSLRRIARFEIGRAAAGLPPGEPLDATRLEDAIRGPIADVLRTWGTSDIAVHVQRVELGAVTDDEVAGDPAIPVGA